MAEQLHLNLAALESERAFSGEASSFSWLLLPAARAAISCIGPETTARQPWSMFAANAKSISAALLDAMPLRKPSKQRHKQPASTQCGGGRMRLLLFEAHQTCPQYVACSSQRPPAPLIWQRHRLKPIAMATAGGATSSSLLPAAAAATLPHCYTSNVSLFLCVRLSRGHSQVGSLASEGVLFLSLSLTRLISEWRTVVSNHRSWNMSTALFRCFIAQRSVGQVRLVANDEMIDKPGTRSG